MTSSAAKTQKGYDPYNSADRVTPVIDGESLRSQALSNLSKIFTPQELSDALADSLMRRGMKVLNLTKNLK